MKKTLLRWLAAVIFLAANLALASPVLADDGDVINGGEVSGNGMTASKYVTVDMSDGSYDVAIEAFATGTTITTKKPVDVVLVVDVSNSMAWVPGYNQSYYNNNTFDYSKTKLAAAMTASTSLADIILKNNTNNANTDNTLSFVTFAGLDKQHLSGTRNEIDAVRTVFSKEQSYDHAASAFADLGISYNNGSYSLKYSGNTYTANLGGTNYDYAFSEANSAVTQLYNTYGSAYEADERDIYLIFMTDGAPTNYNGQAFDNGHLNDFLTPNNTSYGCDAGTHYTRDGWYKYISTHVNSYAQTVYNRVDKMFTIGFDLAHGGFANSYGSFTFNDGNITDDNLQPLPIFLKYLMYTGNVPDSRTVMSDTTGDTGVAQYDWAGYAEQNDASKKVLRVDVTSDPTKLKEIFEDLANTIINSATDLGTEAVVRDIVSSSFSLPKNASTDNIKIDVVRWDTTTNKWGTGNLIYSVSDGDPTTTDTNAWAVYTAAQYGTDNTETVAVVLDETKTQVDVTGFDFSKHCVVDSTTDATLNKDAAKVVITFKIYAKPSAITGTQVETNGSASGIYATADATEAVLNFVIPKVEFTPLTYIIDYAKETKLDYSSALSSVTKIDDPSDDLLIGINSKNKQQFSAGFDYEKGYDTYTGYGKVVFDEVHTETGASTSNFLLFYIPKTTNWNGYDKIFVMGQPKESTASGGGTDDTNTTAGDIWAMLTVMPATSVYYEDSFETKTVEGYSAGNAGMESDTATPVSVNIAYTGIGYTGGWTINGSDQNTYETANDGVHGWIEGLGGKDATNNDTAYTDGSAHTYTNSGTSATATFTFYGTGVDIYSRTTTETGTISVSLIDTATDGDTLYKMKTIDNKAASNSTTGFYSIPTCTFTDLAYGQYTVTIKVTRGALNDGNRLTYYLDGIRVYNPIQPLETEENVINAYGTENLGAVFTEVRSMLLTDPAQATAAAVYIDEHTKDEAGNTETKFTTDDLDIYEKEGPKSEVYLSNGQAVAIAADTGSSYLIGLKSIDGTSNSVAINNTTATIAHTADLYYAATPVNGTITITNNGSGIISVTKLRTVTPVAAEVVEPETPTVTGRSPLSLLSAYKTIAAMPTTVYGETPVTEDELAEENNTEEQEENNEQEETYEDLPGSQVVIDNPQPEEPVKEPVEETPEETEPAADANLLKFLAKLFRSFLGFRRH